MNDATTRGPAIAAAAVGEEQPLACRRGRGVLARGRRATSREEISHGRPDAKTLTEELVAFTAAGLRAGCKSKGGRQ
jgi:hypothetical protein